jgi:uncharacterized protein YjdB
MHFPMRTVALAAALLAASCGYDDGGYGPPDSAVTVASVAVSGTNTVEAGSTTQLSAVATGSDGYTMTGRTYVWSSSNESVATVDASGLVTAVSAGTASITASTGGKSGSRTITVTAVVTTPVVATVNVSGAGTVEVGKTVQLTAAAATSEGTAVTGRTFVWTTSDAGVAVVSSTGLVTGVAAGSATITATVDGKAGSKVVTVSAPSGNTITITGSLTPQAGTTTQLVATVHDGAGNVVSGTPVAWFSSDSTIIAVSQTGLANALRIGTATIAAASGMATGTVAVTSSLAPFTFTFAASMTPAEQQVIKDNVQSAHAFQKTVFDRQIHNPTSIVASTNAPGCAQGGAAAFQSQGALTFCVANPGWLNPPPKLREKIVQHELFHVWQFENHWIGNPATAGATWLIEGAAELMGYRGIADRGLITMPVAIGCQVKESTDFKLQHPPGLPALNTVETLQAFNTTVGPLYTVSMLAAEQLTQTNGLVSLRTYADAIAAGTAWQAAFQTAFGVSTTDFYAQFPTYLASLPVPATYECAQ